MAIADAAFSGLRRAYGHLGRELEDQLLRTTRSAGCIPRFYQQQMAETLAIPLPTTPLPRGSVNVCNGKKSSIAGVNWRIKPLVGLLKI
jgi:hypothetical protein